MRKLVILVAGFVVLAVANYSIYRKEELLANGRVVLLELAPVDPRSLMQGDYMALRFALEGQIPRAKELRDGCIVAALDERGVAAFRRMDNGAPLATEEVRIYYRARVDGVRFGTNAFFFQEGHEPLYRGARFGEARIDSDGQLLLTGLRGPKLEKLGPGH